MISLTDYLKIETKAEHANVENILNAGAIFSKQFSFELYTKHLLYLLISFTILQEIIKQFKSASNYTEFLPADRTEDLKLDLYNLNHIKYDINVHLKKNNIQIDLPVFVGILYVFRGSELGNLVISKPINNLHHEWNLPNPNFYKFKNNEEINYAWKQFCHYINSLNYSNEFYEKALIGAKIGFDLFTYPEKYADLQIFTKDLEL